MFAFLGATSRFTACLGVKFRSPTCLAHEPVGRNFVPFPPAPSESDSTLG